MAPKKKQMMNEDSNPTSTDEPVSSESLPEALSSACTSIVSISVKELLSVFSRLPLCDLQCLELVSRHFRWIALQVYSDRRSLSLIQTAQYRAQLEDITRYWYFTDYSTHFPFGDDCYRVTREVNSSAIQWFGQRFPNVTQLTLYCVDHLSVDRFVQLIQLYPTLERLILHSTAAQQTEYNQPQFWASLYSLRESLCHLHLPFNSEHQLTATQLSPLLTPILRSFYFKTEKNQKLKKTFRRNFPFLLRQYGELLQSRNCQVMSVANGGFGSPQMDNNNPKPPFLYRFSLWMTLGEHLRPAIYLETMNFMLQLDKVGKDRYSVYTHFDLAIPSNIGLLSLLPTLSQFSNLTHIRLNDRKSAQSPSNFFSQLTKQNYRTKLGEPNRTQLTSVRQLNISQFDITSSTGILLYLPIIFPQVHTLCLEDCPLITNSTGKIRVNSFPIWLLNSIRRFGQLHQLYHNQRLVLRLDRDKDGDRVSNYSVFQNFE